MVYNVNEFMETLRKFGTDLGLPKVNVDQLIETQRKNLDALGQAAQTTSTSAEAVIGKQREIVEAGLREASELIRNYKPSGSAAEAIEKQTELLKRAFDITIQSARDVSNITSKSAGDVAKIVRDRVGESVTEIRSAVSEGRPSKGKG